MALRLDQGYLALQVGQRGGQMARKEQLYKDPGHFYSPVCDPAELRRYWDSDHRRLQTDRVDALLDYPAMERFLADMIAPRLLTLPWQKTHGWRYYGKNTEFMYLDASVLTGILAWADPARVIEIGSGYSTAVMFDTLDRMELPRLQSFTTIDPDMTRLKALNPPASARLIERPVQEVPLESFAALQAGDIFFIDSSHVLKTGSDVHYEFLHILPALASGVLVHVHDVYYPFEYPRRWVLQHNRSWNEAYLVDMLLTHSDAYEVLFFTDAMLQRRLPALQAAGGVMARYASSAPTSRQSLNGSIWLRKR